MKVLWVSDLGVTTGFARVSHSILKFIKDRMEVTGLGINYNGNPHKQGFDIYPAAAYNDAMGFSKLPTMVKQGKFDVIFMLQDVWVIDKYLDRLKKELPVEEIPPIVVYFPVDAEEHDDSWFGNFDIVTKAFVYTKFGYDVAKKASPEMEFGIIPHGSDTETFYQLDKERKNARKDLFDGKHQNSFIVLNANRNQPRKRLDISMRGFKLFAEGKEDVALYMHCGVTDASIDVLKLAKRLGIEDKLILSNLENGPQKVSDEMLNIIYNVSDVGLNTSMGEGWGLTATEHAMTGGLQVVPNHSACAELFSDCGILIDTVADYTFDGGMTKGKLVSPETVAKALEKAYSVRNKTNVGEKAKKKFTDDKYLWKTIAEQWYSILKEVAK